MPAWGPTGQLHPTLSLKTSHQELEISCNGSNHNTELCKCSQSGISLTSKSELLKFPSTPLEAAFLCKVPLKGHLLSTRHSSVPSSDPSLLSHLEQDSPFLPHPTCTSVSQTSGSAIRRKPLLHPPRTECSKPSSMP